MTAYVAEPINIEVLRDLLISNWDIRTGGEIPLPEFSVSDRVRFDPSMAWASTPIYARVNISAEDFREVQDGFAYEYVGQRLPIIIEIWTLRTNQEDSTDRQHLMDIKAEIRRIIYSNKHSLAAWQIMKYMSFRESYEDSGVVRYHGQIRLELQNDGIKVPSEEVACDRFTRDDEELEDTDWTLDSGDWKVISNEAALQDATADAVAVFTPAGITFKHNQRVVVDIATSVAMGSGIIFRRVDATNYWLAVLEEAAGDHFLRFYKRVAGVFTRVAEILEPDPGSWVDGNTVEIAVDMYNDCFNVALNGQSFLAVVDDEHIGGITYGMYSDSDQLSRFDSYCVHESGGSGQ